MANLSHARLMPDSEQQAVTLVLDDWDRELLRVDSTLFLAAQNTTGLRSMDHKNKSPFQASIAPLIRSTQAYPALIGLEAANDPDNGESPAEDPVQAHAAQPLQAIPTGKSKIRLLREVK